MSTTTTDERRVWRLYFHADTTGEWQHHRGVHHEGQPHLCRLSFMLVAPDLRRHTYVAVARPEPGWVFDPGSVARHNISAEVALELGVSTAIILEAFHKVAYRLHSNDTVDLHLLAYSAGWHRRVVIRAAGDADYPALLEGNEIMTPDTVACVMQKARDVMRIPANNGRRFKFPSLATAYERFSGRSLVSPPDPIEAGEELINAVALIDVCATEALSGS